MLNLGESVCGFFGLESITFGHDFMELFVTLLITLQFP